MRLRASLFCACSFLAVASMLPACDELAKAVDANNNQPGEADGRAVELAAFPQRVASIATDDKEIVIVAENGDVLTRPLEGTDAPKRIGGFTRANSYSNNARALLDADFIYILDGVAVHRMPRAGGAAEKLADVATSGLAQSSDALFAVGKERTSIVRIDKKTKEMTELATGFGRVLDIAGEADRVDVADQELETITAVAMKDGAKTELAKNQSRPSYIGLGPDHVYWFNGSLSDTNKAVEDRVMRVRKDGAGTAEVVAPVTGGFNGPIRADAQFVYLGRAGYGLFRAPAAGGEAVKYVNVSVVDLALVGTRVLALEDNGFRFSDEEKKKPNRLLSIAP